MNELLNVPPNVSLSECPDLTSLMHLQNAQQENQRRRRMSSGGGPSSISNNGTNTSGISPNGVTGNNLAMSRQAWQGNMITNNTINLPQSSPQGLALGQGARAAVNRTPPSTTSSMSLLLSTPGSNTLAPTQSGLRIQGPSNAVSTSAPLNTMIHPPLTNILAQHLQRGMSKSNGNSLASSSRSNGQQQSQSTSIYASSSNPSQQVIGHSAKTNMSSPPIVSTTTLSLISTVGFATPSSGGDSGIYSMPNSQHSLQSSQLAAGMLSSTTTSTNTGHTQNQHATSNLLQQQQHHMGFGGNGNQLGGTSLEQLQAGRRSSYSGASSGGSVIIGSPGVQGAVGAVGPPQPSPSPQLQGLLMQHQNNPILQHNRGKESHQQTPNGMQQVRRRASGGNNGVRNSPIQPSPNNTRMVGMNTMTTNYQGMLNANSSPALVNNAGNIQATRGGVSSRNRQLSEPLQNSPNPMSGQLQHPSTSHGILTNRLSNIQQSGMPSNQNTLVISRAAQNLQQMQVQPSNQIQIPGSNYVQVPSNQLPPPQPSHISQHSLAQQPPQASPHQHHHHQQQPQNGNNGGGQSLLQQLLSE